ncbi:MAG: 50S ribosomal protein L15 [bacterium]|nr:50S ribosomal protein L15 [bacterium]
MQLHELKLKNQPRQARRVGRGGKRGTFSGKGSKGQQARGARLGVDFRGGNQPIWKVFPKKRGSTKKTDIKHRYFQTEAAAIPVINLGKINQLFSAGDTVSPATLLEKGLIHVRNKKVKILGQGELDKKLKFSGLIFSQSAKDKILKSGEIL